MIHPPKNIIDPVVPPVSKSWRRIDAWLAVHAPASFAGLNPPATPDAIAQTESVIGMPLPSDLRESLLCHNGETRFGTALPCSQLLSAEDIVSERQMRMENWEPEDPDQAETPWWGEQWVPFAGDVSLNFIEAGPGMWHDHLGDAPHDDGAGFLGWPTLGAWLHHVAEAMELFEQPGFAHRVEPPKLCENGTLDWW